MDCQKMGRQEKFTIIKNTVYNYTWYAKHIVGNNMMMSVHERGEVGTTPDWIPPT